MDSFNFFRYGQNCVNVQPAKNAKTPKTPRASPTPNTSDTQYPIQPSYVPQASASATSSPSVTSRSQQEPNSLVEASVTDVCLCQLQPEVIRIPHLISLPLYHTSSYAYLVSR